MSVLHDPTVYALDTECSAGTLASLSTSSAFIHGRSPSAVVRLLMSLRTMAFTSELISSGNLDLRSIIDTLHIIATSYIYIYTVK